MTIKKKLYLTFSITGAVALATTAVAILFIVGLSKAIKDLSIRSEDDTYYAGQIDTITSDLQAEQRGMIFRRMNHQVDQSDQLIKDNEASLKSIRKYVDLYSSTTHNAQAASGLKVVKDNLDILERQNPAFLEQVRQNHLEAAAQLLDAGLAKATDDASAQGALLLELQSKVAMESARADLQNAGQAVWTTLFMLLPTAGAGIAGWLVVRRLDAELRQNVEEIHSGSTQIASAAA